jgi:CDP-glycerol glycerophosphotransferase (TagB/SpsB family)
MLEENESEQLPKLTGSASKKAETSDAVPQVSADFRKIPQDAEDFGTVPQIAEPRENHTLTVRETARMFEAAGVARTERSIINWCQPNRQGIARLDGYYDPNERKYYITPQSVETAIREEIQRAKPSTEVPAAEAFGSHAEPVKQLLATTGTKAVDEPRAQELERENLDLKITNRAKDIVIERMQKERDGFVNQLLASSRTVGQLETKLQRLNGPIKFGVQADDS